MNQPEAWYIVKQPNEQCMIVTATELSSQPDDTAPAREQWGPYRSQAEAIARRVGLIRAGKCQPV
jgi:hypothetical protein